MRKLCKSLTQINFGSESLFLTTYLFLLLYMMASYIKHWIRVISNMVSTLAGILLKKFVALKSPKNNNNLFNELNNLSSQEMNVLQLLPTVNIVILMKFSLHVLYNIEAFSFFQINMCSLLKIYQIYWISHGEKQKWVWCDSYQSIMKYENWVSNE